jgi:cation diffusion facilitator family transporter
MNLKRFLVISLVANFFFAVLKITAAVFTRSSAMISEGIHSVIDLVNQVLMIWGITTSSKSPDFSRPFGYSKELYFWSSIVSLTIFIIGGSVSFYQGFIHFGQPYIEVHQSWNYWVLAIALFFSVFSISSALKSVNKRGDEISVLRAAELSSEPSVFVILLSAIGDLAGVIVVLMGLCVGHLYQSAFYDAAASMIVGVILFTLSFLLIRQCKRLMMSEVISPMMLRKIVQLAKTDNAVIDVKKHFTMYAAPKEALLILEAIFKDDLDSRQVTDSIERISNTIKTRFPCVKTVYIDGAAA